MLQNTEKLELLENKVHRLKNLPAGTFDDHWVDGLYMLKYHMLNDMAKVIRIFGSLHVLYDSDFEPSIDHRKQMYRITSQPQRTQMAETVKIIEQIWGTYLIFEEAGYACSVAGRAKLIS